MSKKGLLIFFSSASIFIMYATGLECQIVDKWTKRRIEEVKVEVYKTIINSEELKSDRKCRVVTIPPNYLSLNYSSGSIDLVSEDDSASVSGLKKVLPPNYWIYSLKAPLGNMETGDFFLDYYHKSDTTKMSAEQKRYFCEFSYDIVKIYDPFDKWLKVYDHAIVSRNFFEVVIPVKYEYIDNFFNTSKERYLLFKIKLDYSKGELELTKDVAEL